LCHASSVAALMEGLNSGAVSAPFSAAMDAEVIIVIGANPTVNHPVAATYIKNAAQRGAKLIVMDPRTAIAVAPRHQASRLQARQLTSRC
jgi:formate dehydrogenase major subunit